MNKLILSLAIVFASLTATAQVGATAPDFTVTDIEGNEINLYEILDAGIIAIVDVSATWCGPCWQLHESHVLQELHEAYGPDGTNQLRVMYYEGDATTTLEDLQGPTAASIGNWLEGSTYPFINENPLSLDLNIWAPLGFPTVNVINPSNYQIVADPWNVYDFDQQVSIIEEGTGIDLGVVGLEELTAESISIYPNPTSNVINLNLGELNGQVTVRVMDVLGKVVNSFATTNSLEIIDMSELEEGNYLVQITSDNSEVTKRVSVIR